MHIFRLMQLTDDRPYLLKVAIKAIIRPNWHKLWWANSVLCVLRRPTCSLFGLWFRSLRVVLCWHSLTATRLKWTLFVRPVWDCCWRTVIVATIFARLWPDVLCSAISKLPNLAFIVHAISVAVAIYVIYINAIIHSICYRYRYQ